MPPVRIVYANTSGGAANSDGISVDLRQGDPWDAGDPFVLARPELFSEEPPPPNFPRRTVAPTVEQATRAPGERRGVRRG